MNVLPSLPIQTWIAIGFLLLMLLGFVGGIVSLIHRGLALTSQTVWILLSRFTNWLFRSPLVIHGSAHWASRREMEAANLFNTDGLPLAQAEDGRLIRAPSAGHILVMGPPRSGKSWGLLMPQLRFWKGSAVISDLRGELFVQTSADRTVFSTVHRFAPAEENSCSINVLDTIRWRTHHAHADVDRIVLHILQPSGNVVGDEFRRYGTSLLRSLIWYLHDQGEVSLPGIFQWLTDPAHTIEEKLKILGTSPNPIVQRGTWESENQSERLRQNVWSITIETLAIFGDPIIARNTAHSDLNLTAMLHDLEPQSLYLCLGFHDIERLGPFLGLLVEVLTALISAPQELPRHKLLFCLDEMANLGRLNELEKAVSYLQGSGATVVMTFQNLAQVYSVYGPDTPLLSSVATGIYYGPAPLDRLTASSLSALLGQTTVVSTTANESTSVSVSGQRGGLVGALASMGGGDSGSGGVHWSPR